MAHRNEPRIPDHLLNQLLAGAEAQSAFAKEGLLDELKKALAGRRPQQGREGQASTQAERARLQSEREQGAFLQRQD